MTDTLELHTILVWLHGQQGVTQYVFRSRAAATEAFKKARAPQPLGDSAGIAIVDDFGREFATLGRHIQAMQLVDVASELNGQAELRILQEHANVKLQRRAQQDAMLNNRPAIVPAGMNGPLPFPPRQN